MTAQTIMDRRALVGAVRRIISTACYPDALDAARDLPDDDLQAAARGDECDALSDATADAAYGCPALRDWVAGRGMARRIKRLRLVDLGEAFEESGIGWDRGITLSRVPVADLVDLVVWEIEHGIGPLSHAFCEGCRDAEVAAAREAHHERNEKTPAVTGVKTRK